MIDFNSFNNPAVLVAIIPGLAVAINSYLKSLGMNSKFSPLVNLGVGLLAIYPFILMGLNVIPAIVGGLIVGLSAG